jgi:hypothetical protein
MTQTDIPTWCVNFQLKLMAALDAAWAILDATDDPTAIRQARDKAKAIGDLAAMARKVALITPFGRPKPPPPPMSEGLAARFAAIQGVADFSAMEPAPAATQADHARRALDKLKGGRRGRL